MKGIGFGMVSLLDIVSVRESVTEQYSRCSVTRHTECDSRKERDAAGPMHARHQGNRGGFVGSIWTEDGHDFARLNRETDVFKVSYTTIVPGNIL